MNRIFIDLVAALNAGSSKLMVARLVIPWDNKVMHTKPPKLLRSAGRDNVLPRVYNFTSLRFQVGDTNRRLGDHGRYTA